MIHGVAFERGFQSQLIFPPHRFEKCSSHQLQNGPEVQGKGGGGGGLRMPREEPLGSALACLSVFLAFLKEMWETGPSWLWARAALLCQGWGCIYCLLQSTHFCLGLTLGHPPNSQWGSLEARTGPAVEESFQLPALPALREDSRKGCGSIFIQMMGAGSQQPGLQRNQCLLPRTGGARFAGSPTPLQKVGATGSTWAGW